MKDIIRFATVITCIIGSLGLSVMLTGCKGGEKKSVLSPEATVERFTRHIAAGEFDKAAGLCDTVSMRDYIENCINAWERHENKDSSVFSIASGMLSEIEISIGEIIKEEDRRHVFYSISVDDNKKDKLMILQKEEGEWKVTAVADRS